MSTPERPTLRELFLRGERRLEVYFYTSNVPKYLQAATVFERSGLILKHFRSKTDPYHEDYALGKQELLTRAIAEILNVIGKQSLFFVEDTSLRIEALSNETDEPGLAVKEWFEKTTFRQLNDKLLKKKSGRGAVIKSDIALHVPGLPRPLFFHGETPGQVAETAPKFQENAHYPWLTPNTFNGWFIPEGASKRLGEMSLEESWKYDFRTQSLEQLILRLEEYAAILNLPPHAYSRRHSVAQTNQLYLFSEHKPLLIIVGKTCAGKSTFGEWASKQHGLRWAEASNVLRTLKTEYEADAKALSDFEFAKLALEKFGPDIVARKILQLFETEINDGLIITGFRTIEELETIKATHRHAQIVFIDASERNRFLRYLARGRAGSATNISKFRDSDRKQWSFGLLRVAEEFADIRLLNDGGVQDFWSQIEHVIGTDANKPFPGVSHNVKPRHGLKDNQLYRCLLALEKAGRSLSCDEIQKLTKTTGEPIRPNNANKVLKRVPELAKRFDALEERVRYEITNAGRAYIRYMNSHSKHRKKSIDDDQAADRVRRTEPAKRVRRSSR